MKIQNQNEMTKKNQYFLQVYYCVNWIMTLIPTVDVYDLIPEICSVYLLTWKRGINFGDGTKITNPLTFK